MNTVDSNILSKILFSFTLISRQTLQTIKDTRINVGSPSLWWSQAEAHPCMIVTICKHTQQIPCQFGTFISN